MEPGLSHRIFMSLLILSVKGYLGLIPKVESCRSNNTVDKENSKDSMLCTSCEMIAFWIQIQLKQQKAKDSVFDYVNQVESSFHCLYFTFVSSSSNSGAKDFAVLFQSYARRCQIHRQKHSSTASASHRCLLFHSLLGINPTHFLQNRCLIKSFN